MKNNNEDHIIWKSDNASKERMGDATQNIKQFSQPKYIRDYMVKPNFGIEKKHNITQR